MRRRSTDHPPHRRLAGAALAIATAAIAACGGQPQTEYDLVLSGGRVMDPESGLDEVRNVGIIDGRIVAVSEQALTGEEVVDVTGLVVAPGFIDLHAHGQDTASSALQAMDGVTTALELESGVFPAGGWYADREGKARINYGATAGHTSSRIAAFHGDSMAALDEGVRAVLGAEPAGFYAAATPEQIGAIRSRMASGLDAGALGLGFGINYTPGAAPEEIDSLFALAAERGAPVFVHTRAFGNAAVEEAIATAERTGAALHIVHIGSSTMGGVRDALAMIEAARERGVDVTTEVYPYTAASTFIESAIFDPGWQETLGISYGDLEWAATGERLTEETFASYRETGGWVIIHMIPEETVELAVGHPGVIIASDGVPFIGGRAHPRGAGSFARVLGLYVREKQTLSLMDAIGKMTYLPAKRLETYAPALAEKGRIREGADADITVFDPATVLDRATFAEPAQGSAGISHVIVGGTFVVRDGRLVPDAFPGEAVKAAPATTT